MVKRVIMAVVIVLLGSCAEDVGFVDSQLVIDGIRLERTRHKDGVYYWLSRDVSGRLRDVQLIPNGGDVASEITWLCTDRDKEIVYGEVSDISQTRNYYFIIDEVQVLIYPTEMLMRAGLKDRQLYESDAISPGAWLRGRRPG